MKVREIQNEGVILALKEYLKKKGDPDFVREVL